MKNLIWGLCLMTGILALAGCTDRNVRNESAAQEPAGSSAHHMTGDDLFFDEDGYHQEPEGQVHVDFGRK